MPKGPVMPSNGMPSYDARRMRLLEQVQSEGLDALLVTSPNNVTYLTGFASDSTYLLLSKARTLLISDGRYTTQLAQECPGLEAFIRPIATTLTQAASDTINKIGPRNVGFESNHLTFAEHAGLVEKSPTVSWKSGADRVEKLRVRKDEWEIAQIREAIRFAERAFGMLRAMVQPDDSEKDLADALEGFIRRAGGKCSAFAPIVAVGSRAALPHALPAWNEVSESPLLLIDWGANGAFYKSDLTRVLFSDNNSANLAKHKKLHEVVLGAQAAALAVVRPGIEAEKVDAAARDFITAAGYGEFFNHSTGHGFGLQIHEQPFLKQGNKMLLEAGMVVTLEPGIYLPDWGGIRIEDDVLVTPDGGELLSHLPKTFEESMLVF